MMPTLVLIAALQMAPTSASSQSDMLLTKLTACRMIRTDAERLACFDDAAGAIGDARQRREIVILDRGEVRRAKRSLFGFSLPSIRLFGTADAEPVREIAGELVSSATLPGGRQRFVLLDSGTWEGTEQTAVGLRVGDMVTIKAGSLGSYVASAPGRRSIRVRRLQ